MVYQGIDKVCREENRQLDIRGNVLDSCPGRRPLVTLWRLMAVTIVNYICQRRDGATRWMAFQESYRFAVGYTLPL